MVVAVVVAVEAPALRSATAPALQVFLAEDETLERRVAIKLIATVEEQDLETSRVPREHGEVDTTGLRGCADGMAAADLDGERRSRRGGPLPLPGRGTEAPDEVT